MKTTRREVCRALSDETAAALTKLSVCKLRDWSSAARLLVAATGGGLQRAASSVKKRTVFPLASSLRRVKARARAQRYKPLPPQPPSPPSRAVRSVAQRAQMSPFAVCGVRRRRRRRWRWRGAHAAARRIASRRARACAVFDHEHNEEEAPARYQSPIVGRWSDGGAKLRRRARSLFDDSAATLVARMRGRRARLCAVDQKVFARRHKAAAVLHRASGRVKSRRRTKKCARSFSACVRSLSLRGFRRSSPIDRVCDS